MPSSPIIPNTPALTSAIHEKAKPPNTLSTLEQAAAKLANSLTDSMPGIFDCGSDDDFAGATQVSDSDYSTDDDVEAPSIQQKQLAYLECQQNGSDMVGTQFKHDKFHALLRGLGTMRKELAKQHIDSDVRNFGKLRELGHQFLPMSFSTKVREKNYPLDIAAMTAFLKENVTRPTDQATATATHSNNYNTTSGKNIPTTEIAVAVKDLDLEKIPCTLMHTNTQYLDVLMKEASTLFNTTVEQVTTGDKEGAINSLSQFVYLFAHAMPFHRGSAMVGEMFTHGILEKIGVQKDFEDLKGLDFLAFTNTQESFEAAFRAKLEL